MTSAEVKAARVTMRRIQEHLRQAQLNLGAIDENVGFVDVIYHEVTEMACLNYVTPRRKTAWVSGKHIEVGLEALEEKGRPARVRFAEGLYPSIFVRSLRELGLRVESDVPMMAYDAQIESGHDGLQLPPEITIKQVTEQQAMSIWWYVWRNAFYDVLASGVEPLVLRRDLGGLPVNNQIDLILYRNDFPIGVSRMTLQDDSAHLVAQAILKEAHTPELEQLLHSASLQTALQADCDFIFADGSSDQERSSYRELGFVDASSILSYAKAPQESWSKNGAATSLGEPVLII